MVVVGSGRELRSLALGKDRARHLEFGELFRERQHAIVRRVSVRHAAQTIAERQ